MQTENGNEVPTFTDPNLKYIKSNVDALSNEDKRTMYEGLKFISALDSDDLKKLSPFRIRMYRRKE